MDNSGKYEGRLTRAILSCDAFTTGYLAICLLLAVPYIVLRGGVVVLAFLPIACLLPFVMLPLFYTLIHRVDTLLFGRYHLVMPISAFVAALFFVMAFGAKNCGSAGGACAVFFGASMFVTAVLLYRYCAFSVRARLSGDDPVSVSTYKLIFAAAGVLSAIAAFFGFMYYDAQTSFINTAYVIGSANIVLALVHYLTSYYGIPRLGGKRVQSVKTVFRAFFTGLDKRTYFSALLFKSAFCIMCALTVYFCAAVGLSVVHVCGVIAALVLSCGAASVVCMFAIKRRSMSLSVVGLVCYIIGGALFIVAATSVATGAATTALIVLAAIAVGVGGAVTNRQTQLRFLTIKPRATGGTVFILTELTSVAAAAVAMGISAAVAAIFGATLSGAAFIYGFAFAAVVAIAAFVIAGKRTADSRAALAPTYEYGLSVTRADDGGEDAATD